jgi:hypothetical protein
MLYAYFAYSCAQCWPLSWHCFAAMASYFSLIGHLVDWHSCARQIDSSLSACRLCKVSVLPKRLEAQLTKASAYAEVTGYVASITLKLLALQAVHRRISAFKESLCSVRSLLITVAALPVLLPFDLVALCFVRWREPRLSCSHGQDGRPCIAKADAQLSCLPGLPSLLPMVLGKRYAGCHFAG